MSGMVWKRMRMRMRMMWMTMMRKKMQTLFSLLFAFVCEVRLWWLVLVKR